MAWLFKRLGIYYLSPWDVGQIRLLMDIAEREGFKADEDIKKKFEYEYDS